VLLEKRRPQLEHLLGTVLEHAEDRLAVATVERDDPGFAVIGTFEQLGGVDELGFAEAGGEAEDGFVGDWDPTACRATGSYYHGTRIALARVFSDNETPR
jgi:hypothetical protein